MELTNLEREFIKGYAHALQHLMFKLTGENSCAKHYDPCEFGEGVLHSYAFNLKDGGRHHPLSDYESVDEITLCMLKDAVEWCKESCKPEFFDAQ